MKTITFIIGAVTLGGVAYYLYKRKTKKDFWTLFEPSNIKVIDGTLDFNDVIAYFKSKNLKQGSDIPFIAQDGPSGQFAKKTHKQFPIGKDGHITIVLGVYNKTGDKITHAQVLYVKKLDEQTRNVLGEDEFVVLS